MLGKPNLESLFVTIACVYFYPRYKAYRKSNKDMSFSNSNIAVNDSLTYSHYNSTTGATVINSTLESEEYHSTLALFSFLLSLHAYQ